MRWAGAKVHYGEFWCAWPAGTPLTLPSAAAAAMPACLLQPTDESRALADSFRPGLNSSSVCVCLKVNITEGLQPLLMSLVFFIFSFFF